MTHTTHMPERIGALYRGRIGREQYGDWDSSGTPGITTPYIRYDLYDAMVAENKRLKELIRDAIEDADEFETEWNKEASAALKQEPGHE